MAALVWTEPALCDLDGIADYIALDNADAAARLVQRVFAHVELLAKHPELGPRVPELLPGSRYRQLVEPPCRVFYRYDRARETVLILGVMRRERLFRRGKLQRRDKTD
jgi:plasmid stabilization system protein ParE